VNVAVAVTVTASTAAVKAVSKDVVVHAPTG